MSLPIGVVRFPGTNCDRDVFEALVASGARAEWLWHADRFDPKAYRAIYIPGGFSYGDYLRAGALAARSPVMQSVRELAQRGAPVLGICNGFQILCETGLLPGALIRNSHLRFVDAWVILQSCSNHSHFSNKTKKGERLRLPIAHADGCYFANSDDLSRLQDKDLIWWKYDENPNGSAASIAGVVNESRNVGGLMPHPERALYGWMGGTDGLTFFDSV